MTLEDGKLLLRRLRYWFSEICLCNNDNDSDEQNILKFLPKFILFCLFGVRINYTFIIALVVATHLGPEWHP